MPARSRRPVALGLAAALATVASAVACTAEPSVQAAGPQRAVPEELAGGSADGGWGSDDPDDGGAGEDPTGDPAEPTRVRPTVNDHWHIAYGVEVCGELVDPFPDEGIDRWGIHTHEDGVIHVHPFTSRVAGEGATFEVFLDQVGIELTDTTLTLPDRTELVVGEPCPDGAPAELRLVRWDAIDDPEPASVDTGDLAATRFTADGEVWLLQYGPPDPDPEQPPSIEWLRENGG